MSNLKWSPVSVRLGQIEPWTDNPRMSTKAQAERLIQSERELGQVQTVAIGPANDAGKYPLYDGHQRFSAWYTVKGAEYELTALQSNRPLTEDERRKMSILLHTATGGWNWDKMAGWQVGELKEWGLVNQENIKGWNNDANNVKELLKADAETQDAEPQIDRAGELLKKWKVKTGDLWQIGEHRLLCGDSTKREDVKRVMGGERASMVFTDAPYNVAYASRGSHKEEWGEIENDDMSDEEFYAWFLSIGKNIDLSLGDGAAIYLCHGDTDRKSVPFIDIFRDMKWKRSSTIIWAKQAASMGWQDYRSQHECISYGWKNGAERYFTDDRSQTTLWEISRDAQAAYEHPTQKPVELPSRAIVNSSKRGDAVVDFFCGSGTTLVACQNLGRRGRAIEISPAYCAVTLERMATAFPGIEIKRI